MLTCRMSGCGVAYSEKKASGRGNGDHDGNGNGNRNGAGGRRMKVGQSSIRMWLRRG